MGDRQVKLVDTSSWIEYLRGNENETARRVKELIRMDHAGWCELIKVELWNGVRPGRENKALDELENAATLFPLSEEVWRKACRLALRARESGLTVPANDIVITACARHFALDIECVDAHFTKLLPLASKL